MPFTQNQIIPMLKINKHRLDDELELQPQISHDISDSVAAANARLASLKESLSTYEAELLLDIKAGPEKLSAPEVAAMVETDQERKLRMSKFMAAKKEYESWVGLLEAWKQRGFALKTLADLYLAGYYVVTGGGHTQEYSSNRAALSEARQAPEPATIRRRKLVD